MEAVDAIEVSGGGVDCNACGLSTDLDLDLAAGGKEAGAGGAGSGAASGQQAVGQCAFARAIKAAAATHVHRHQYYAAIVQTSHRDGGGGGGEGQRGAEEARDARDGGGESGGGDDLFFNGVVGYEEFLVHRPAGDEWIAGALPPPTSVRRASFGPQLRGELLRLAVQQSGGAAGW